MFQAMKIMPIAIVIIPKENVTIEIFHKDEKIYMPVYLTIDTQNPN